MSKMIDVTRDDIIVRPFIDPDGKLRGFIAGLAHDFPYHHERELPESIPATPADALNEFVDERWPELAGLAVGRAWRARKTDYDPEKHFDDLLEVVRETCPELEVDRAFEIARCCERGL